MLSIRPQFAAGDVEDLLHERGIEISHKMVRFWRLRFGPMFDVTSRASAFAARGGCRGRHMICKGHLTAGQRYKIFMK